MELMKAVPIRSIAWLRRWMPRNTFLRNVFGLAGASALGQAVSVLASPVITRLYDPSDFGLLAVYTSLVLLLSSIMAMKYEFAIPLPREDQEGANLVILCLILIAGMTILLWIALFFWSRELVSLVDTMAQPGTPTLGPYLWLVPVAAAGLGTFQVFNYWIVRRQTYSYLGFGEIMRRTAEVSTQFLLGVTSIGTAGLLTGGILMQVSGGGFLAGASVRRDRSLFQRFSRTGLLRAAVNYRHYPVFAAPAALCNTAGLCLPPLLIAGCYSAEAVGCFALAQRVISMPSALIGRSISHVYFGEAAQRVREQPHTLTSLYTKATGKLTAIAIPLGLITIIAPDAFALVFGENWRTAGEYCRYLAVPIALQFVVISTSQLTTYGVNHWQLGWDVFRLAATTMPLVLAFKLQRPFTDAVAWYAAGAAASFILLFVLNLLAIRRLERTAPHAA